jgi:hypothetical protein
MSIRLARVDPGELGHLYTCSKWHVEGSSTRMSMRSRLGSLVGAFVLCKSRDPFRSRTERFDAGRTGNAYIFIDIFENGQ